MVSHVFGIRWGSPPKETSAMPRSMIQMRLKLEVLSLEDGIIPARLVASPVAPIITYDINRYPVLHHRGAPCLRRSVQYRGIVTNGAKARGRAGSQMLGKQPQPNNLSADWAQR